MSASTTTTAEALLARYGDALRAGDVDAVLDCFTPDAEVMAPGAPTARGPAVRELYAGLVPALLLDITFTVDLVLEGADGRTTVLTRSTGTQVDPGTGQRVPEGNREAFVLSGAEGDLRISHYLFNEAG